jgi:hypothetical protein
MNKQKMTMSKRVHEIPERVALQVKEVASYAYDCDDWVTIKKEIMKACPSNLRSLFSRRDPITKEQIPNEFDRSVIRMFEEITGQNLVIRTLDERRSLKN